MVLRFFINRFKSMGNVLGVSWACPFKFPRSTFNRNLWKIILEILVLTPLHFVIDSRLKINGKCSWSFLGQFLQVALSNPYSKSLIIIKRKCNGRCLYFVLPFCIKSLQTFNGNHLWASLVNSPSSIVEYYVLGALREDYRTSRC